MQTRISNKNLISSPGITSSYLYKVSTRLSIGAIYVSNSHVLSTVCPTVMCPCMSITQMFPCHLLLYICSEPTPEPELSQLLSYQRRQRELVRVSISLVCLLIHISNGLCIMNCLGQAFVHQELAAVID